MVLSPVLSQAIARVLQPIPLRRLDGGAASWNPAQWFLANEQGIWLDPSDFTRYMGEKGPELVPNSNFSAGLSGWSDTSPGTYTVIGDRLLVGDNGGTAGIYRDFAVTPGATYLVRADVELTVSGGGLLKAYPGGGFVGELATATMVAGRATPSLVVKATTASIRVYLNEQTVTVGAGFYVASVSLRELTAINTATMFQDSAGTTPVTAVEQPVGLVLDKRLGLVPGAELFATATTNNASVTYTGGVATFTGSATSHGIVRSGIATAGKWFKVTLRVVSLSGGTIRFYAGSGSIGISAGAPGTYTCIVTTSGTTDATIIAIGTSVNAVVDQIDVRELPGSHAYQPTTAQKPVLSARKNLLTYTEDFSNAVWTKANSAATADTITVNNSGGTGVAGITRNMTITAPTHVFSVELKANTLTWAAIATSAFTGATLVGSAYFDLANGVLGATNQTEATITAVGDGWYRCTAKITPDAGDVFGNFAIYLADGDNDITVSLNGTGSIYARKASLVPLSDASWPYQRVNTNTDYDTVGFPHYLKFDGVDDSLVTGNIDFTATDKMTVVAGLTKLSDAAVGVFAELSVNVNSNAGSFFLLAPNAPGQYALLGRGSVLPASGASKIGYPAPSSVVVSGGINIAGDSQTIRISGAAGTPQSLDLGTGNFGNYPLYIGRRAGTSFPFNGHLYSLTVRGAATDAAGITAGETYTAGKTGITL